MRGNTILVSAGADGKRIEGVIYGTPKPGTVMQVRTVAYQGGRDLWEVYSPGTDGKARLQAVLLEDYLKGGLVTDAYVNGDRGFMYVPRPGDELNMLVKNLSGTGDDHSALEILEVDDATGMLIPFTGTPEQAPWQLLEDITDPTSDTLAWCRYIGG